MALAVADTDALPEAMVTKLLDSVALAPLAGTVKVILPSSTGSAGVAELAMPTTRSVNAVLIAVDWLSPLVLVRAKPRDS